MLLFKQSISGSLNPSLLSLAPLLSSRFAAHSFATRATSTAKKSKTKGTQKPATPKKKLPTPKKKEKLTVDGYTRAPSAYNIFVKSEFSSSREGKEDAKEVIKKLAQEWKNMGWQQKEGFAKSAEGLKTKFAKARAEAKASTPVRPANAYINYVENNFAKVRSELGEAAKPTEVVKKLAGMWKALSLEEKDRLKTSAL